MQRKYVTLSAFVAVLSVILFPSTGSSENVPFCYMRDSLGQIVDLEQLCQQRHTSPSTNRTSQMIQQVSPSGDVLLSNGTFVTRDGMTFRLVYRGGRVVRVDVLRPDGSVVQLGENAVLPNGLTVRMPSTTSEPGVGVFIPTSTR